MLDHEPVVLDRGYFSKSHWKAICKVFGKDPKYCLEITVYDYEVLEDEFEYEDNKW